MKDLNYKTKNFENETIIFLTDVPYLLPPFNKSMSMYAVRRWVHMGVRGIRLEAVLIGKRYVTSIEAVGRFIRNQHEKKGGCYENK